MILWVLTAIFVLFILFAFLRKMIHKITGFKVCAICAAVSLTWIVLLVLRLFGLEINSLLLGILMGESITGIMYLFERNAKKTGKNKMLWLKVIIIILGTLLVYLLLTQGFSAAFSIILIISIIIAILIIINLRSKNKIDKNYGKFDKEVKKLEEQLEHCCD